MPVILFIEPSALVREPLAALLRKRGHEVVAASDEREARANLSALAPDLILIDPFCEGRNGAALLERVRQDVAAEDVPIIAFSDCARREDVLAVIAGGVTDYLLKPAFGLSRFLQRIDTALQRRSRSGDVETEAAEEKPAPNENTEGVQQPQADDRDPVEILKELKPIVSRSEISDAIDRCGELKAMSPTVGEVLKMTQSPNCSTEALAKVIKRDHAIALKILKLANSSVYTRGEPVDSILKAVVRIGMGQIRQAVMNISVIDNFASEEMAGGLHNAQFWEHAIACGLIASEIAHDVQMNEADSAFTLGLVHDVGRCVLAQELTDHYNEVLSNAHRLRLPLDQVEKRLLLFNHADVMDRILRSWHFPRGLINPVAMHHLSAGNIRKHCPSQATESMVLALANRLTHALMLGNSGNETIASTEEYCKALKLRPNLIERLVSDIRDQTDDIKFSLLSTSDGGDWPERREEHRSQLDQTFRPLYISDDPTFDAFRIFTEQLADPISNQQPNIAVVHVHTARESSGLSRKLVAAEQEQGLDPLPLIVISPAGRYSLEKGMLESRAHRVVASPFVIDRFLEAVNGLLGASLATAA